MSDGSKTVLAALIGFFLTGTSVVSATIGLTFYFAVVILLLALAYFFLVLNWKRNKKLNWIIFILICMYISNIFFETHEGFLIESWGDKQQILDSPVKIFIVKLYQVFSLSAIWLAFAVIIAKARSKNTA